MLRLVCDDQSILRIRQKRRLARLRRRRQNEGFRQNRDRTLRVHIERTNGLDFIVKKFEAIRLRLIHRKNIDDIAPHRDVPGPLDTFDPFISAADELSNAGISVDDRTRFPSKRPVFQNGRRRDFLRRFDRRRQDDARLFHQKRRESLHPPPQCFRPHVRHGKIGVLHDRK